MNHGNQKIPHYFRHLENKILGLSGIWSHWEENGHTIDSCSIITTEANDNIMPYHHRMPLILAEKKYQDWISNHPLSSTNNILNGINELNLNIYQVDKRVNRASYNEPDCLSPAHIE